MNKTISDVNISNFLIIVISLGIAIVAVGTSVVTAVISRRALKQTQDEIKLRLRPWLGPNAGGGLGISLDTKTLEMRFEYLNYGSLPAFNLIEKAFFSNNFPTDNELKNLKSLYTGATCFPKQVRGFTEKIDPKIIDNAVQSGKPMFCCFIIEYEFGISGKGKFGSILEYCVSGNTVVKKEWFD